MRVSSVGILCWYHPEILMGALIGKRIYDRIPQRTCEIIVLTMTVVAGVSLLVPR